MNGVAIEQYPGTPNTVMRKASSDFYISYNHTDVEIYGCDTTALVVGQMEAFYILNGNHLDNYRSLIDQGFEACLEYFKANIDQMNKHRNTPNEFN